MKRNFVFVAAVISSFIFLGSVYAQTGFGLTLARGQVDTREIAGRGLYVFSIWNEGRKAWVENDGRFSVHVLSGQRPQKLTVHDHLDQVRAVVIVPDRDLDGIVFDARSTAFAVLFGGLGMITSQQDLDAFWQRALAEKTFSDFVHFLKKHLPAKPLDELVRQEDYRVVFEKCYADIFGQSPSAARKSLHQAQDEIEDLLSR